MINKVNNDGKLLLFDGTYLYLQYDNNVWCLGTINTRKGRLTKSQKLKAVASIGKWVKL